MRDDAERLQDILDAVGAVQVKVGKDRSDSDVLEPLRRAVGAILRGWTGMEPAMVALEPWHKVGAFPPGGEKASGIVADHERQMTAPAPPRHCPAR